MDEDDPEQRIAELENQQAATASKDRDLTADDVHSMAFSKPPFGKRGYDEDAVDALMARLEHQLRNPQAVGALTAADVYRVTFPKPAIGKRGYHEDEVDAFLDRIGEQLPPGDDASEPQAFDQQPTDERRRRRPWVVVLVVVLAAVPLYFFGYAAYDFYGYSVGTPAVATVTSCPVQHSSGRRSGGLNRMLRSRVCTGTWTVDGQSYTGEIEGPRDGYLVGSLVDVRAHGDEAFTTVGISWRFLAGSIALLIIGLVLGYMLWLRRVRSRR